MKKNLFFRVFPLFFALCLVLSVFASCNKNGPPAPSAEQNSETGIGGVEDVDYLESLGASPYEDREFRVMTIDGMYADATLGGSVVQAATFRRDEELMDHFNIEISYGYFPNNDTQAAEILTNTIQAGTETWHSFVTSAKRLTRLSTQGLLVNLRNVPHLDLDQPWWSQTFNDNCTFNSEGFENVQFVAAGPFSELFYHSALCLAYNTAYVEQYSLPDIITMVNDGTWTLEQMYKLCNDYGVVKDNGDGVMNKEDQYAVAVTSPFLYGTFASSGGNFSTFDGEGEIVVNLANERSINILTELIKLYNPTTCYMEGIHSDAETVFLAGRSLFMYNSSGYMIDTLPSSSLDYNIVPCPKYDENQKEYVTCAWPDSNYCVGIGVGMDDEELGFSGLMLEAWCYLSDVHITPAKYGTMISYRLALNEETSKMLDLIFDSLYFDMNLIFDFGATKTTLNERLAASSLGRYTTLMKNAENVVKSEIAALMSQNS